MIMILSNYIRRTSEPLSQRCKARIMGQLVKTEGGRARIAAVTESLDRTFAEIREKHRTELPQGENEDMVQRQTPPEFEANVEFIPMEHDHQYNPEIIHRDHEDVSREVVFAFLIPSLVLRLLRFTAQKHTGVKRAPYALVTAQTHN